MEKVHSVGDEMGLAAAIVKCLEGRWIRSLSWPGWDVVRWTGRGFQLFDPLGNEWGPDWGIPSSNELGSKRGWTVVEFDE